MSETLTIGITGGIGAGKSVVSRVLRCNGFRVYDCDLEAKRLMKEDQNLRNALTEKLGCDIYNCDGAINRNLLASLLFSDASVRVFVNSVVHKAVREDIKLRKRKEEGLFFIESALLATSGLTEMCDNIWLVVAPKERRIRRIAKRDNLKTGDIEKRMGSQSEEIKLIEKFHPIVIENDNGNSVLTEVLRLTDKYINNQTYTILC